MSEDANPLLTSLRKQREGYVNDLQATALNLQRLQGAIAALDRAIEGATIQPGYAEPAIETEAAA